MGILSTVSKKIKKEFKRFGKKAKRTLLGPEVEIPEFKAPAKPPKAVPTPEQAFFDQSAGRARRKKRGTSTLLTGALGLTGDSDKRKTLLGL